MSNRHSSGEYDIDMQLAKGYGIDAFALNIGVDPYTDEQLNYAYDSAARNGIKVFISFDFNWWSIGQAWQIGQMIARYGVRPAQLYIDGAALASSFAGDGIDVGALKQAAGQAGGGMKVLWMPNFHPGQGDFNAIDGALNWMAWPNNGYNKAPDGLGNISVRDGDRAYISALRGKPYIAPVSPWFFTHFGPEVPYSKNWVFPGDLLWFDRWNEILVLGPKYIELVTWNDYGESHYIGPLSSSHQDDGASKWVNDIPHNAWLDMSKPYVAAFKAGATKVDSFITEEQIVYWYRINKADLNCDPTDTTMVDANNSSGNYFHGRPYGSGHMSDSVFVVTLLKSPGILTVNSGSITRTFNAPAGAAAFTVPMGLGRQSYALARNGRNVLAAVSLMEITNVCKCGLYNFNPYVGSIPPGFIDPLGSAALASLTQGLHVQTCFPTPSLPTTAPSYTGPGGQPTNPPPTSPTVTQPPTTPPITPPTTLPTSPPTPPPSPTPTGSCTITASSQIFPTNCLQPGCVWNGPAGQARPDKCDKH